MDREFAIAEYHDATAVTRQLDELIKKPIYTIKPEALKKYEEEYYQKKCKRSKALIDQAIEVIPGGVQHNLAFNYPFPLVFTKAEGALLYDIDGNEYYDFLQAGGPTAGSYTHLTLPAGGPREIFVGGRFIKKKKQ